MSASPITVSVHVVRPVIAHARGIGLDVERLLGEAGLEPGTLEDGDARVPHAAAVALRKQAVLASGDEAFGLHAAETAQPPAFDVLGYAMMSSATLGDAWSRLCRYHRLFHDAALVSLEVEGALAHLSHRLPAAVPPLPRARFQADAEHESAVGQRPPLDHRLRAPPDRAGPRNLREESQRTDVRGRALRHQPSGRGRAVENVAVGLHRTA